MPTIFQKEEASARRQPQMDANLIIGNDHKFGTWSIFDFFRVAALLKIKFYLLWWWVVRPLRQQRRRRHDWRQLMSILISFIRLPVEELQCIQSCVSHSFPDNCATRCSLGLPQIAWQADTICGKSSQLFIYMCLLQWFRSLLLLFAVETEPKIESRECAAPISRDLICARSALNACCVLAGPSHWCPKFDVIGANKNCGVRRHQLNARTYFRIDKGSDDISWRKAVCE